MSHQSATASASANIALIKYWGKAAGEGNVPATGSLSLGLDDLRTTTRLTYADGDKDEFIADLDENATTRIGNFLDMFRQEFEIQQKLLVETSNNFPTGTGLASSASGFAALTLACNALFNLNLGGMQLSRLARRGSGSAARSIYGGIVEVVPSDDAFAIPVQEAAAWPLDVVIAVTQEETKSVGSTEAMRRTANTSPYYQGWLDSHPADMTAAKEAIADKNFEELAGVSEHNCLKMHAAIMSSRPAVIYWQPATVAVMHLVRELRAAGKKTFFSIDAGAQVKVICDPTDSHAVAAELEAVPGVLRVIHTRLGGSPTVAVE